MNNRVIGKCSQCGGIVSVPTSYLSTVPPTPSCEKCGAVMDVPATLPVVPTIPVKRETQLPARRRPLLRHLICDITEDNIHEAVDFGPPVGKEII